MGISRLKLTTHGEFSYFISLFAVVSLAYLATLSKFYNFDGVACAIAVELADPKYLFHGNHLIYGFAGFLFHRLISALGLGGMSITSLQLMNILFSALSIGVFYLLLYEISKKRYESLLVSLFAAFSFGFWFWSMEAQVYPLAFAPMVYILYLGAKQSVTKNIYLVSFLHLFAVLVHIIHFLYGFAVLFLIYSENKQNFRVFAGICLRYAAALFGGFLASYGLVVLLVVKPESFAELLEWFYASAALTPDKSFEWHGSLRFSNILILIKTNYALFAPFYYRYISEMADISKIGFFWKILMNGVLFGLAAVVIFKSKEIAKRYRKYLGVIILWLLPYFVFFSTWEPQTLVYSLANVFPFFLLFFLGIMIVKVKSSLKTGLLLASLAVYVLANYYTGIMHLSSEKNNALLQRSYSFRLHTPQDSIVLVKRNMDKIYIPYFGHRHPFYAEWLKKHPEQSLDRITRVLAEGRHIYVLPDVLDHEVYADMFRRNFTVSETELGSKFKIFLLNK